MIDVFFSGYGAWLVWEDEEANYPISDHYRANGVFKLTDEDELKYSYTKSLKDINTLCPSDHAHSEFSKMLSLGKFDSELTRLAEDAKFHLGSEWLDPEQFHSALEKDARFHFNANKEMSLVIVNTDNIKTKSTAAKNKRKTNGIDLENNNDKVPVAIDIDEPINKENPSLPVEKIDKKTPIESTSKKSGKDKVIRSDFLPKEGFLRIWQIIGDPQATPPIPAIIPICRSTLLERVKKGTFPEPVKLGQRCVAWRVEEIREWIEKPRD